MNYVKFPKANLTASRVCLGCMGFDGAARSTDLVLTSDEIAYLEELYVPHALVGVMAQNGKQKAGNVV